MRASLIALIFVFVLAVAASAASGATPIREISVRGARVHLGDVLTNAPPEWRSLDLGPSPSAGGSRIVERADVERALREGGVAIRGTIPSAVRVVRRTVRLDTQALENAVRDAVARSPLPAGVALSAVRPSRAVEVAEGWTRVVADIPRPPHHAGPFATTAMLAFEGEEGLLARVPVAVVVDVSDAAAVFDIARGASIRLVVRRGLIEVTVSGTTTTDADIGGIVPVMIAPSGRVVRARILDRDHAEPLGGP